MQILAYANGRNGSCRTGEEYAKMRGKSQATRVKEAIPITEEVVGQRERSREDGGEEGRGLTEGEKARNVGVGDRHLRVGLVGGI